MNRSISMHPNGRNSFSQISQKLFFYLIYYRSFNDVNDYSKYTTLKFFEQLKEKTLTLVLRKYCTNKTNDLIC